MKIQLYEITKCGFYESWADDAELKFGTLPEWWGEFFSWVNNKDYKETSTFTSNNEPNTVYCIGRADDVSGNYGVALWNRSTSWDGAALHLPPAGRVDNIQAEVADVEDGATAGWPSYFWFMPDLYVIVALIPEGFRGSGIPHARKYFAEYLKTRSGYCRPGGFNERGFPDPLPYIPRFETTAPRRPGQLEEIAGQWDQITKYVTKTTFEAPPTQQRSSLQRGITGWLPNVVGGSHMESRTRKPRSFKVEADWRPESRDAVVETIRSWDDHGYDDNNWAGVIINNRLYRFDKMTCREPVELSDTLDADPRWDTETLVRIWQDARPKATSLINQVRRSSVVQD